jgi:hypothetical protein
MIKAFINISIINGNMRHIISIDNGKLITILLTGDEQLFMFNMLLPFL